MEEHGYDVRYLLSQPLPRHHLAADYAEALLATHPVLDDVRAVLAFCMAAPLAQEVAARISCPLLVFFDGEPSSPEAIRCEFRQIQRSLAGGPVAMPSWWSQELVTQRSDALLRAIEDELRRTLLAAVSGDPFDEDDLSLDEPAAGPDDAAFPLISAYLDWLAHLVASYHSDYPAWGGDVVNLVSRQQPVVDPWPGAASTRTVRMQSDRASMLAHGETRGLVLDILGARKPPAHHLMEGTG
ncbi:hypothetical protein [Streptomyces decoyicus]|uniref:hypothetical protein n=1 Tax=Streptomyces decoyicus TaxID=249567 RepID=UPI0033B7CCEC